MSQELIASLQTESYAEVKEILTFMLEECSLDEAPSNQEVQYWQQILQQRGGKFQQLAWQCQQFLQENS